MSTSYVIRGGEQGRSRMSVIARAMWPTTERLLLAAGLTRGMRCLDLGCGAGDVSLALARFVGVSGSVNGVDQDDVKLQFAREDADGERLSNIQFRASSVEQLEARRRQRRGGQRPCGRVLAPAFSGARAVRRSVQ